MIDNFRLQEFMEANYTWLTEWLTNVYINRQSGEIMQVFASLIKENNIFRTIKVLEKTIMQSLIAETKTKDFLFDGFIKSVGRIPTANDSVLIEARRWMELSVLPNQFRILSSDGANIKSDLGLICEIKPIYIIPQSE